MIPLGVLIVRHLAQRVLAQLGLDGQTGQQLRELGQLDAPLEGQRSQLMPVKSTGQAGEALVAGIRRRVGDSQLATRYTDVDYGPLGQELLQRLECRVRGGLESRVIGRVHGKRLDGLRHARQEIRDVRWNRAARSERGRLRSGRSGFGWPVPGRSGFDGIGCGRII